MFKHYVKVSIRNLLRYKGHSSINILGLAVGVAACILLLLFLRDELGYDRFHEKADRIYRITQELEAPGQPAMHAALTSPPLAPVMREEVPGIVETVRIRPYFEGSVAGRVAVRYGDEKQFYDRFFWADDGLFRIFTFSWLEGEPSGPLREPNTVVLSESMAQKYFGGEPALGKVLRIDTGFSDEDYRVTGVVRDLPYNSHIHLDVIASFASLEHLKDQRVGLDEWWLMDIYSYVLLAEGASAGEVESALPAFVEKHFPKLGEVRTALHLQPLTDIHLRSRLLHELEMNGDIGYVYIFAAIAVLTLLIACVNFVNLSIARFAQRAREVGVRKVVGAHRSQLVQQFLGESMVLALLALVLAVVLVLVTLPAFNAFSGKRIELDWGPATWLGLIGLALLVGTVAGSYPAVFLSSFRPVQVLKSSPAGGTGNASFRKILITLQFSISVALLIGTGIIYDQLRYMRGQDLGIDMEQVLVLPLRDMTLRDRYRDIKEEIVRVPGVLATTFSSLKVGWEAPILGAEVDGAAVQGMGSLVVDHDFLEVFKVPLVAGRDLLETEAADENAGFLVNEAAVRKLGLRSPEEAVGKPLAWAGWKKGQVVGVVRDFHYRPLQHGIEPLVLHIRPIAFHYLYLRIAPQGTAATLQGLESAWRRSLPGKPFEYVFLDDDFRSNYRSEERLGKLVGLFALLAVFVACLGLLGLASFTAERRTREIGIRKVLGSSVAQVVLLLSREFTLLVLLANLIAWPVAYWLMRDWLQDFAYRTEIHPSNFVLGGLTALVIAWLTVSYRALQAALVDPAKALRYE